MRIAWIVGGVKGLGARIAIDLANDGYDVIVNYRKSKDEAEQLQHEHPKIHAIQGDGSRLEDIQKIAQLIFSRWGRLDALICTLGPYNHEPISAIEVTDEMWEELVHGNLSSVFYCVREVVPMMRKKQFGRIIHFGFAGAESSVAWKGHAVYAAAKSGLASFTRSLALEEAANGITVNMINPGDIHDPYKETTLETVQGIQDPKTPIGRPGTGQDISRVVRYLLHPDSDFITGSILSVTGGFQIKHKLNK